MAADSTSTLEYQFKRVYGKKINELVPLHTMTYNQFAKSDRKAKVRPGGAGYYFSTRQKNRQGVGARIEGAYLPEPLTGDGVQGYIKPVLLYGVIRMNGLAIEAGKGDMAAFVDAQGDATMDIYNSLVDDLNRQCWGDGYGLLGTSSAVATPDTDTTGTWDVVFDNDRGVRYMRNGEICDFHQGGTMDATASSVRISAIDYATKTVTFEGGVDTYATYHPEAAAIAYNGTETTIASGSYLTRQGARYITHTTSLTAIEMNGLNALYDDGTAVAILHGITTANDAEWKANLLQNSSVNRELSIDLMLAAVDMTAGRSGGSKKIDLIRTGLGQRRKYYGLLAPDIRFAPEVLKGGYGTLSFSQNSAIEMIFDPMSQPNRMYFEPKDAIKRYELKPIGWGGFDPNKMHWRPDYDQATMFLNTYTNLGTENRTELTLLDDLTEPSSQPF